MAGREVTGGSTFLTFDPITSQERIRKRELELGRPIGSPFEVVRDTLAKDASDINRNFKPTFIDPDYVRFQGAVTDEVRGALADRRQIVINTSEITPDDVYDRFYMLAEATRLI